MATVKLYDVNKVYDGGVHAVHDFNIEIKDNEFIVFVGPSGCGKSTTLRMIAGLEEISYGDLFIDDVCVNNVPPKDRGIAMVFQSYALYPQMTVFDNMAYSLKLKKVPKAEIKQKVYQAAEILGLIDLLDRKPKALSGGQRQRVALGRAIVRKPKVFLMDEPLSNLDAKLRVAMRAEIVRIHKEVGATTVYVTHDQVEAMTMADRIVVMKDGFVQQIGTPTEIYENPSNMFVAGFIGAPAMNFMHGMINQEGTCFISNDGHTSIPLTEEQQQLLINYHGKKIVYGIRPEHLIYDSNQNYGRFKNTTLTMTVKIVELLGDILNCHGRNDNDENIIVKTISQNRITTNSEITVAINTDFARFFNVSTRKAITLNDNEYEEVEEVKIESKEKVETTSKTSLWTKFKKLFKKDENK